MPAPRVDIPNLDDLVERYLAGASASELADEVGVSDNVIRKRLRERGIAVRPRSSYSTNMLPAHEARRGQVDDDARKAERAATRYERQLGTSANEDRFAELLDDRGYGYRRQVPCGPYNLDFALTEVPVAVEVVGGGYNPRVRLAAPKRVEYVLDVGWHLVSVAARPGRGMVGAANYVVAVAEHVRSHPSAVREHRMVRPDGQLRSSRRPYLDDRSDPASPVAEL